MSGGFEFQVQDLQGVGSAALGKATQNLINAARQRPELAGVFTLYSDQVPQVYLDVDREKAQTLGIPVEYVYSTMQTMFGSLYVSQFNKFSRLWQVILQAEPSYRLRPEDLEQVVIEASRPGSDHWSRT